MSFCFTSNLFHILWHKFLERLLVFYHVPSLVCVGVLLSTQQVRSYGDRTSVQVSSEGEAWARGYKTFFMLSSVETKIYPAHKC